MKQFAESWPDDSILPQLAAKLPWGHHRLLLDRARDPTERTWYARAAVEHGWSRSVLDYQIDSGLYHRQGRTVTNFVRTLPPGTSDLAMSLLKDPYDFEFLGLTADIRERDLHRALLVHIRELLLEMGAGFAFVGSEVPLEVEGDDYHVDLLFYHLRLRSFVVVELKTTEFRPEHAGKLNFYLSAVDDLLRRPDDGPSIGLVICRGQKRLVAEYALRDLAKPIGIAAHRLGGGLPEGLRGQLPTVEELESGLRGRIGKVTEGEPEAG